MFEKNSTFWRISAIVSGDAEIGNMSEFFKNHNMHLHLKTKGRHSHLVENAIRSIKRALYFILRRKKSTNWAEYLSQTVKVWYCMIESVKIFASY